MRPRRYRSRATVAIRPAHLATAAPARSAWRSAIRPAVRTWSAGRTGPADRRNLRPRIADRQAGLGDHRRRHRLSPRRLARDVDPWRAVAVGLRITSAFTSHAT